ncbi:MAG: hypothetical protein ACK502_10785 [Alphaproteobacteria bacterium]|jgi:hypothetical protein
MSTIQTVDFFEKAIKAQVNCEIEKIIELEIAEAQKRVSEKIRSMTDRIALSILSEYDMRMHGNAVVITVKK